MAEPFLDVFRKVADQNPKRHFPKSVIQVASAKGLIMPYQIPAGFAPSRSGTLDGDGGDGDNRTPDEGRSGRGETRRDAGVMPVHERWTTGEEWDKAEEDGEGAVEGGGETMCL